MGVHDIRTMIDKAEPELRAAGLSGLYLFGSEARGEARADSDIDLAFEVARESNERFSLLDQIGLQQKLEALFGRKVDFVERSAFHPLLKDRIERELVKLF